VTKLSRAVMDDAVGIIGGLTGLTETGRNISLEWLLLPLRHGGKTHSRMIGSLSMMTQPAWLGLDPVIGLSTLSLRIIRAKKRPIEEADPITRRQNLVVLQGGRSR